MLAVPADRAARAPRAVASWVTLAAAAETREAAVEYRAAVGSEREAPRVTEVVEAMVRVDGAPAVVAVAPQVPATLEEEIEATHCTPA